MRSKNVYLALTLCSLLLALSPLTYAQGQVNLQIQNIQLQTKQPFLSPTLTPTITSALKSATITPTIKLIKKDIPIVEKDKVLEEYKNSSVSLSINPDVLLFSEIAPTNPQLQSSSLSLTSTGPSSISLYIYTSSALQNEKAQIIPDTTCDTGGCSTKVADTWNSSLTYGFGYRCNSLNCKNSFNEAAYFKPFAHSLAQASLIDQITNTTSSYNYTFKLNTQSSQPKGIYTTNIIYLITPDL